MTDLRQAAQQALEALEGELWLMLDKPEDEQYRVKYAYLLTVITALRTALEQQAEPMVDCPRCGHVCSQRPWVDLTDNDWGWVADRKGTSLDTFDQGAAWAANRLKERNNG